MSEEQAKYDGGPAFPRPAGWRRNPDVQDGMSLRDWFAGQALAGLLVQRPEAQSALIYAQDAYAAADAMLAWRAKGEVQ